ncbi:MAG: oligosaccharide repeat unit polymerase [Fibrobacter sp.]|nr:oligosaccharide repeat unit polymerase [Fibrobacter sp.]
MFSWVMEYPESTFAFLLSLFCLVQAIWLKRDFFSPITVYCFSQSITLGIAFLRLDPAMTDFKPKTWMIWILGMVAFCTGSFLVKLYAKSKRIPCEVVASTPAKNYNWHLHLFFSFAAFLLFLVGVYGVVQTAGNLLIFTGDPAKWMSKDVNYGYYALLISSGPLPVLLFGVASFKKFNSDNFVRLVSKFMVIFTIVLNLCAYPNRTALFFNVGFLIILVNFLYKRISPIVISFVLVLAVGAFVGISSVRSQYGGSDAEGKAMDVVMKLPYMYVANNYWNLDYAVNSPPDREIHPHTYGVDFFHGIFEYARVSGSFRTSFRWDDAFNERIQKVYGFNTVNYLWDVYKDFFIFGVFFFPLLCGMGLTLLYLKLCRPFTPRQVALYTFFIYFVGWWFFTSGYKQGIYCIWGALVFVVTTICSFRPRNEIAKDGSPEKAGELPADALVANEVDQKLEAK